MQASLFFDGSEVPAPEFEDAVLRNHPAFLEAQFGARRLGAYTCPVNWHFKADDRAARLGRARDPRRAPEGLRPGGPRAGARWPVDSRRHGLAGRRRLPLPLRPGGGHGHLGGGVNIYPAEIEAALIVMPGVADCAVFGIPDPEFGESLAAAVQTVEGFSLNETRIKEWLAQRIAGYKVPRLVVFHEQLPLEDSGKIFKRRPRAPYWEKSGRSI